MTEKRPEAAAVRRWVASIVVVTAIALVPHRAAAEKVVPLTDGWQIYTDGRAAGFASWAYGDAIPPAISVLDANGNPISISTPQPDGGFRSVTEPPANPADPNAQGKINIMRLRSGFLNRIVVRGTAAAAVARTV